MAGEPVLLETQESIATITLNRPEKLNPLDEPIRDGLTQAIDAIAHDSSVRVIVITGAGRGFCSGGDIEKMMELKRGHRTATFRGYLEAGHQLVKKIRSIPKPVVASVNGPAAGAGMSLALACDLRIASDQASFTQAFVKVGLHPDWGATFFLPRLIGMSRAIEMFFLGEPLQAAEAHRLGLVNFLVSHDQLIAETHRLARRLTAAPALPLGLLKQAYYRRHETELNLILEHEVEAQMKCFESEDFTEGIKAFLEKRPPRFQDA